MPFAKGEGEGGPRIVKCHSKRFSSRGAAWKSGVGFVVISAASLTVAVVSGGWVVGREGGQLRMRLMVVFLAAMLSRGL